MLPDLPRPDGSDFGTVRTVRRQLCRLLLCIIFAGGLQILFGLFKLGFFANYIPNNVILGLLAAIGVILIATQIPYLLGLGNFSWRELWSDQVSIPIFS